MCGVGKMGKMRFSSAAAGVFFLVTACLSAGSAAIAYDGLVEKKVFEIPTYTTTAGSTIKMVKMGYETYGELNKEGNNAILIPPFLSANSHAAGKYNADDSSAGYWDSIIGQGRPLDTGRFFVVSVDGLADPQVKDGKIGTCGPSSIDPDTGKPYGMRFPSITIRDFVEVEKALLDRLGVKKLYAVMGASMGSFQTLEWAAAYPEMVERIIAVVGSPESDAFTIGRLECWIAPIMLDPHWNGGDYYGREAPLEGLKTALKLLIIDTHHPDWANEHYERKWASPDQDPAKIARLFREYVARTTPASVESSVRTISPVYPALVDRNHPAVRAAGFACKKGFGAYPVFLRSGGSIPVVNAFQRHLGVPVVLMGFGLPDDRIHAPNEKFHLPNFYRGIETSIWYLATLNKGFRARNEAGRAAQWKEEATA